MMIMRNSNRLINDFKNQTKDTIWKHLDAMAANCAVFSTHLNGLSLFLTDYDVYLYCNDTNVVILSLDCCGTSEEQVYEESDSLSPMLLADGCEPRASVVYKLSEGVGLTKELLQNSEPEINVYGVLLTEAEILNSYARFIANQLERIYIQHATRCIRHQPEDKQDLLVLTPEDISPIEIPRQKTRIGF